MDFIRDIKDYLKTFFRSLMRVQLCDILDEIENSG